MKRIAPLSPLRNFAGLARALRLGLGSCLLLLGACGGGYGGGSYGGGSMNGGAQSPPVITMEPQSISVSAGKPASFNVAATGYAPLSYQWMRNGMNIAGATMASYTIAATAAADNGASFAVQVSNAYGKKTSSPAVLTVM